MKVNSIIAIFAFLLPLPQDSVLAQSVPPLMNYQGSLTDATGQALPNGQYMLTFNVYNVPTGGTAVWGPQAITADVIDGYFNVVLSADSTGGDSISTAFTAQPRYVSIRVDAGAEILPRQQVLSAPYAIQAGRSAASDVVSPTSGPGNIFPSTGNVGIGTTTPDRPLIVEGASKFAGPIDVTGALAVNGPVSVTSISFSAQKFCRTGQAGQYTNTVVVPSSWTAANCQNFLSVIGGNIYVLGCMFGDGTAAIGTQNTGAPPSPNCGW
ncbi:MAG: hypothetical protein AB7E72_01545 [Lysobacterales bacterium]